MPSPDFSHPQLYIPLHFFIPESAQHPFTFVWGSFFQHFPRCTEVGADPHLLSALTLEVQHRLLLPVISEAACQEKVHLSVYTTWFLALPSSALLSSAFVTTYRTAETLGGCGVFFVFGVGCWFFGWFLFVFFLKSYCIIVN